MSAYRFIKLHGGGPSWRYLVDENDRIIAAVHEDDRAKTVALETKYAAELRNGRKP